jgi:hypothetical protein
MRGEWERGKIAQRGVSELLTQEYGASCDAVSLALSSRGCANLCFYSRPFAAHQLATKTRDNEAKTGIFRFGGFSDRKNPPESLLIFAYFPSILNVIKVLISDKHYILP